MNAFVATDFRVHIYKGRPYAFGKHYVVLERYYHAFGRLTLCCRRVQEETLPEGFLEISELVREIVPVESLLQVLLGRYQRVLREKIRQCDLLICRCHGMIPFRAFDAARALGKPVLAEAMACAWDGYWNHGIEGKLLAPYMFLKMRQVMRKSDYAAYVTQDFLQRRYPRKGKSLAASNVRLEKIEPDMLARRWIHIRNQNPASPVLMTTAAVDVAYKGQQYVIHALPRLNALGIHAHYVLAGEGDPEKLRRLACRLSVEAQVEFAGRMPLEKVLQRLDGADIYLQPSLQEGLPRAVIEAMSRGCLCIGARTAGIPELLEPAFLVRRRSVRDLVRAIAAACRMTPEQLERQAERNLGVAGNYTAAVLKPRREAYYRQIRENIHQAANRAADGS